MLALRLTANFGVILGMPVRGVDADRFSKMLTQDLQVQCQFPDITHVLYRYLSTILTGKLMDVEILRQLHNLNYDTQDIEMSGSLRYMRKLI